MTERTAILIVEDEAIVALDLQQTLNDDGYDAFAIAASADEAIRYATERVPDLVLMDIRIKGQRDGVETASVLRHAFDVPVVFLTAHADDATLDRAKRTAPHGYLHKPVKPAALRSTIEVALYNHAMERRARLRERWFSTTLRSIADAVICVDLAGTVNYMNPPAEELTGVRSDVAMGKPVGDVMELLDAPEGLPVLRALRAQQIVAAEEANLVNKHTGVTYAINDSAAPVVDDTNLLGAVMVFRDITEQKKLQRQVELSDRLASLGTLAAGVAHEINNPLAAVMSNAQFVTFQLERVRADLARGLEVSADLDALLEPLADVENAASRIGRIVADLRTFSHLERRSDSDSVDIGRCLQWALRTTAHEFRQRARVTTSIAAVPAVVADETRLGQVFINVLVNAAHAIAPGHADTNHVRISTGTTDDGEVVVTISDSGCGIAEDVRARIFEPFFTTKAPGRGTGLGLSISHGIVRSLGGRLEVDSVVDQGTTVRVILPAARVVSAPPPPAPAATAPTLRGRILVIDDETLVLRLIARVLRGHDIVCVDTAGAAIALLENGERFDAVLCDLNMPTMTGVDFYEVVLARFPALTRQIAFLSGGSLSGRVDDFLKAVSNPRLQKPFDIRDLEALVVTLLQQHPQA